MTMYLDDIRTPVQTFDFVVRSFAEAVEMIEIYGVPIFISFDHDLGVDSNGELLKSGYDFAKWLVKADIDGMYTLPTDFSFKVHSQNPVGRENIKKLLENYLKMKNQDFKRFENGRKR